MAKNPPANPPTSLSVDYHRFRGAACPTCRRIRATTIRTQRTDKATDPIIRYHVCGNCGCRFKSVECVESAA